jgi:hypothetical protein
MKKNEKYRAKQREIKEKMNKLHFADEEYYLTSEYLLKLASKASELFESSEVKEKRLLLKLTLQNLELKGKKVRYPWQKPFDTIANYASRQAWLERWYDFGRIDWVEELEYPEFTRKKVSSFLSL